MFKSNSRKCRRGSALLICTLAAAVISMASIAILRSSQRSIARVESLATAAQGRYVADGLFQRGIALLRTNPNFTGALNDVASPLPGAWCQATQLSPTATQLQIFLYAGSTIPVHDVIVDPTTL